MIHHAQANASFEALLIWIKDLSVDDCGSMVAASGDTAGGCLTSIAAVVTDSLFTPGVPVRDRHRRVTGVHTRSYEGKWQWTLEMSTATRTE